VPRAEFACCRVGDDGDWMAAQMSRAALRLLSGLARAASWCIWMAEDHVWFEDRWIVASLCDK
jgi:hypothetical protein